MYCPSFDLYTAAQTRDEVLPSMTNAAGMFIRVCYDRGLLEQVLQKRGFQAHPRAARPPGNGGGDVISVQEAVGDFEESFPFEVPMPLVSGGAGVAQPGKGRGVDAAPVAAALAPRRVKTLLERLGYAVVEDDEYHWAFAPRRDDAPIPVPKKSQWFRLK